jgi:ankyrin repeat protein
MRSASRQRAERLHMRLCFACANSETDKVAGILAGPSADVGEQDSKGRQALHIAASSGNQQIVELLIKAKASVNATDEQGNTPLVAALMAGHAAIAKLLRSHGATHGSMDMSHQLCAAAMDPVDGKRRLQELYGYGGKVNSTLKMGMRTALHLAAAEGHIQNVRFLLEVKANPNAVDAAGRTPLQDAVHCRHDMCASLLLANGAQIGDEFDAAAALNQCIFENDMDHLTRLIEFRCAVNSRDDFDRTPLHIAASCKRVSALQYLLEQPGIEVNPEDVFGRSPFDDAMNAEAHDQNKVHSGLLANAGGLPGSLVVRTSGQTFRNNGFEEMQLESASGKLTALKKLLTGARELASWVERERADVSSMSVLVARAIAFEREHGSVLADEMPELWPAFRNFAYRQAAQYEYIVLTAEKQVTEWMRSDKEFVRENSQALMTQVRAAPREQRPPLPRRTPARSAPSRGVVR